MRVLTTAPRTLVRLARDGWLAIGITLLLFLGLESVHRMVGTLRHSPKVQRPEQDRRNPQTHQAWWKDFLRHRGTAQRGTTFDPYRGWRLKAYAGPPFLVVDSNGIRQTLPAPRDTTGLRRVFMLGGSSLWGVTARDSFTIPSLVSRELQGRGYSNVEVVNLGMIGYNITQEASLLLTELAHRRIPDAVVVFDGYNDIETGLIYGEPGHAYDEARIDQQLQRGRLDFGADVLDLGRHSALVRRLAKLSDEAQADPSAIERKPAGDCRATAQYYGEVARMIEGMGERLGFVTLFFQQPFDAISGKRPSSWEQTFRRPAALRNYLEACSRAIDSTLAMPPELRHFSLRGLFDADSETVFLDWASHLTEAGNAAVARTVTSRLLELEALRPRPAP